MFNEVDQLSVNAIRTLSIDAIEKANSDIQVYLWGPLRWLTRCGRNL